MPAFDKLRLFVTGNKLLQVSQLHTVHLSPVFSLSTFLFTGARCECQVGQPTKQDCTSELTPLLLCSSSLPVASFTFQLCTVISELMFATS